MDMEKNEQYALYEQSPGMVFVLNDKLEYQYGNKVFLDFTGFKNNEELKGKTGYDMPWAEYAPLFRKQFRVFLASDELTIHQYNDGVFDNKLFESHSLSTKILNKETGELDCIVVMSMIVNEQAIMDNQGIYSFTNAEGKIEICLHGEEIILTQREGEVLRLLAQCRSALDSAEKLHISAKTVEYHINNIKQKFNVHTKKELTNILIASGLMSYLLFGESDKNRGRMPPVQTV